MTLLHNILLLVQILSALGMIGLILVQHGKGADMGAAFGSGGSGSLFGASGGANFLSRTTSVLAAVFFVCTLGLAYFGNIRPTSSGSVLENTMVVPPQPSSQIPGTQSAPVDASIPAPTQPGQVPAAVPTAPAQPINQIPGK
ncbi:MAG: preprotein translocase subunit SecG [Limnohabitans sp.]|nr:preprotein translocase subunit SecG [Limnohabitans sp.]